MLRVAKIRLNNEHSVPTYAFSLVTVYSIASSGGMRRFIVKLGTKLSANLMGGCATYADQLHWNTTNKWLLLECRLEALNQ